jgi:hypothetical protein
LRSIAAAFVAFALLLAAGGTARADTLSAAEMGRLLRGETVERAQSLDRGERHYVGGLAYTIVDSAPEGLAPILSNIEDWRRILPSARSAKRVGELDGDTLVEMTHGSALVQAKYTMRVHREDREVKFWMDPRRFHDIEDAWGFLRAEPLADGRTLVVYGVLIDMGPGLLRDLFEGTVRRLALSVPDRVRAFARERSALAAARR